MEANRFEPFFRGYLKAVVVSLVSLHTLFILSIGVLDWFFLIYMFMALVASIIHFLFMLGLYLVALPLVSSLNTKAEGLSPRVLIDRYIPIFALPFASLFEILWMEGGLNKFFTFVILDLLFTCYIGLYFYTKNKCAVNETA
ncbi:MAG TPA: hypothetical protein VK808_12660 [Bacteroidia bacterium]|jgi:hypothetical protein|nr:hypothetical protein [Bacteroidia bacterium]